MLSASWQLCLGIIAFYIGDSLRLLFRNEVIFSESGGRWRFHFADDRWVVFGKCLYLPNPLTPARAIFRASWSAGAEIGGELPAVLLPMTSLMLVRGLIVALLGLLVVVLPTALVRLRSSWQLCVLAASYLLIVSLLGLLWRRRDILSLTAKRWRQLALDALICPPFAINTFRKLTFDAPMSLNAVDVARELLDAQSLLLFLRTLIDRIDIQLQWLDDDDETRAQMNRYRQQLQEMLP